MVISEFFIKYAEEANCKAFFKAQRAAEHFSCKKCGSVNVFWQEKESRWRCKDCKHPMGLKKWNSNGKLKLELSHLVVGLISDESYQKRLLCP